jgi:hypothetical protein
MMDEMIAFCGITCSNCLAFLATQKDDDSERKEVAEKWSKEYNSDIKPEDINCDGCLVTTERIFNYCKECQIRKCGMERKVKNCACCEDYACEKLSQFHERASPELKQTLDEIKKNL